MDYTLAGIRNRILVDKLDDDEFDPQVVDNFINDTQREIFNTYELPFMEKIFSGTLPSGSTIFQMPTDVALVQSRVVTTPTGKQKNIMSGNIPFREFNERYPTPAANTVGPITYWTLYANNMLTSQPTDQDYTLMMFYIKKATTLVESTDVPELPEEFSEMLVLGALMRIHDRNEDSELADKIERQYIKHRDLMVGRYGFRESNGPLIMKNSHTRARNTTKNGLVEKSY